MAEQETQNQSSTSVQPGQWPDGPPASMQVVDLEKLNAARAREEQLSGLQKRLSSLEAREAEFSKKEDAYRQQITNMRHEMAKATRRAMAGLMHDPSDLDVYPIPDGALDEDGNLDHAKLEEQISSLREKKPHLFKELQAESAQAEQGSKSVSPVTQQRQAPEAEGGSSGPFFGGVDVGKYIDRGSQGEVKLRMGDLISEVAKGNATESQFPDWLKQ